MPVTCFAACRSVLPRRAALAMAVLALLQSHPVSASTLGQQHGAAGLDRSGPPVARRVPALRPPLLDRGRPMMSLPRPLARPPELRPLTPQRPVIAHREPFLPAYRRPDPLLAANAVPRVPVRVSAAPAYQFHGRSLAPFRAAPYPFTPQNPYRRYAVGEFLPLGLLAGPYVISDWNAFRLLAPTNGAEWLRYGNDMLLVDPINGFVSDAAYGAFSPDPSLGYGPTNAASYAAIGIASNNDGAWTTREASTLDQAEALALVACNQAAGACANTPDPVPGDQPMCFALYEDGSTLYESQDPDLQSAAAQADQDCQGGGDPNPVCILQISGCNDQ